MAYFKKREPVDTNIDPNKKYTNAELTAIADELLRQQSKFEQCTTCGSMGEKTGNVIPKEQPVEDGSGNVLWLDFEELACENGHSWVTGEGKPRGLQGDNPILFEEHLMQRRKREIYTTVGVPDPSIVAGIYNRIHPQGRKVNTEDARRKHGASFYR